MSEPTKRPTTIALVGRSGSGKSTIADAIVGEENTFGTVSGCFDFWHPEVFTTSIKECKLVTVIDTRANDFSADKRDNPKLMNVIMSLDCVDAIVVVGSASDPVAHVQLITNIKALLGEEVSNHLVAAVTDGNFVNQDGAARLPPRVLAPETFETLRRACQGRVQLFDPESDKHVDQLLALVWKVRARCNEAPFKMSQQSMRAITNFEEQTMPDLEPINPPPPPQPVEIVAEGIPRIRDQLQILSADLEMMKWAVHTVNPHQVQVKKYTGWLSFLVGLLIAILAVYFGMKSA